MFERLKDVLYEISDVILALVIILLMTTVITWKITNSLTYPTETIAASSESSALSENTENSSVSSPEESTPTSTEEISTEDTHVNENASEEPPKVEENVQIVPEETTDEPEETQPTVVTIEIPNGSPGIRIAKILKNNDLIDDTSKFIARVESLNMGPKLKSGTFNIKTGTSLDDIIYIIAGKKK